MWYNDFEDLVVVSFIVLIILSFCSYRYYYYPVIHTPVALTTLYEEPIMPVVQPVIPVVPIIQPVPVYQPVYHSFYRPRRYCNNSTVNVSVNNCNTSCKPVNTCNPVKTCAPVTAHTTHTTTRSWNPFRRSTTTHTTIKTCTPVKSYCAPKPNYSSCKTTYKTTYNKPVKICAPLRAYKHSCRPSSHR